MNILLIAIFCIFTVSIYGEFNVTYQYLKTKVINTHKFNPTDLLSSIRIHKNKIAKDLLYEIHSSQKDDNITYANKALALHAANPIERNEGVLHSNDGPKLAADDPSSSTTTTEGSTTTTTTEVSTTTSEGSTTTTTEGSTTTTTEGSTTTISGNLSDATHTTTSGMTLPALAKGEPPPTRSAQLGMGLGITFIGFIIIGEITYFKIFYREALPSDDYTV